MLKRFMNLQLFAEPEDGGGGGQNPPAQQTPPAQGKVFSEEYVNSIRSESAGYRTKAKTHEVTIGSVRKAFGLKDDEEIGDVSERLTKVQQAALEQANSRLIKAEMKSLDGYDLKLLEKLIDLKDVKVDDEGNVTGIKEAAEAVAKEYPAVKSTATPPRSQFAPTNPTTGGPEAVPNKVMNDLIRGKRN